MLSPSAMVPTINYPLILTLLLSALFHGILLLGMDQLKFFPPPTPIPLPLEIILVPFKQEKVPKKPNVLAQAVKISKSEKEEKHPPTPGAPSPLAASSRIHASPAIQTAPAASKQKLPPPKQAAVSPLLTQKRATPSASKPQQIPASTSPEVPETASPRPSARELIAALEGQLAREIQRYANQPRKRYLDSSTTEYAATAYLDAWRKKIERVGKMNYPEEAKRRGLSGSLILVVDLNPDGTVANIVVRHSSDHQALDKAAIRIVRLAAPFANVPANVLQGHDILSITRTWQFHSGKDFSSR